MTSKKESRQSREGSVTITLTLDQLDTAIDGVMATAMVIAGEIANGGDAPDPTVLFELGAFLASHDPDPGAIEQVNLMTSMVLLMCQEVVKARKESQG